MNDVFYTLEEGGLFIPANGVAPSAAVVVVKSDGTVFDKILWRLGFVGNGSPREVFDKTTMLLLAEKVEEKNLMGLAKKTVEI